MERGRSTVSRSSRQQTAPMYGKKESLGGFDDDIVNTDHLYSQNALVASSMSQVQSIIHWHILSPKSSIIENMVIVVVLYSGTALNSNRCDIGTR